MCSGPSKVNPSARFTLVAELSNGYDPRVTVDGSALLPQGAGAGVIAGFAVSPADPGNSRARNLLVVNRPGSQPLAYVPTVGDRSVGPTQPSPVFLPITADSRLTFRLQRPDRRFDGATSPGSYDIVVYTSPSCGCGCKTKE